MFQKYFLRLLKNMIFFIDRKYIKSIDQNMRNKCPVTMKNLFYFKLKIYFKIKICL